jgi:glycosyltransferase involved in cell wall biosynthesis
VFSLIVATMKRVAEVERLLASLEGQTYRDFEVIVIDQNPDERLVPVLARHESLDIQHLRSLPGASRARNVGLRVARGDIIAIPDDDCWYPEQLLATVNDWFVAHPEFDVLLGITRNAENKPMLPKWAPGPGSCAKKNLWSCTISNGMFWRRIVSDAVGFFNENLGVGAPTKFQSSEESDYGLRALALGFRVWYEPQISIYHAEYQSFERLQRTSYSYALGIGYVARLHHYSWWFLTKMLARSLGGAALYLCKGELAWVHIYWLRACGQFQGYVFGSREMNRMAETSPH